jgi:hypothetical protein
LKLFENHFQSTEEFFFAIHYASLGPELFKSVPGKSGSFPMNLGLGDASRSTRPPDTQLEPGTRTQHWQNKHICDLATMTANGYPKVLC